MDGLPLFEENDGNIFDSKTSSDFVKEEPSHKFHDTISRAAIFVKEESPGADDAVLDESAGLSIVSSVLVTFLNNVLFADLRI